VSVLSDAGSRLQIGTVDVSAGDTVARDIRATTASRSAVAIRQVSMAPPVFSNETGALTLESIDATGADIRLASAPAPDVCERAHAIIVTGGSLAAATSASLERLDRVVRRLHRDLLYVAVLLPAAFFLLKLWVTAWTRRWRLRLVLGVAGILVPLVLYRLAGNLPLTRLATLTLAASALSGSLMYRTVYRHGARRHERWEPFAVDIACVLIVLPFAAVSFTSGAPRELSSVRVGRVSVQDISLAGSRDRCGRERSFAATMPSARIDAIELGLPVPSHDETGLTIAAARIPRFSAAVRDARDDRNGDVDVARVTETEVRADDLHVTLDWKAAQVRDIEARIRLHGLVESAALVGELRTVRVLAPIANTLGALEVDVDVRATGAGAPTPLTDDLERFDDPRATLAVRARLTLDPQRCALTYASAMRVLTPQARLIASGAGDLSRLELRSIRTLPGSAVEVARGSGMLSFGDRTTASVTLHGVGIPRGPARVRMASADISVSTTPACAALDQTVAVAIAGAVVTTGNGTRAGIARTALRVSRRVATNGQAVSLRTRVEDVQLIVRSGDDTSADVAASLPALQVTANGSTTSERIPRRVDGALDLSISTAADGVIRNTTPLRFLVDVWDGVIMLPDQPQVLHQSVVSGLPPDLAFSISLDGRLPSTPTDVDRHFNARVRVPRVPIQTGPLQIELRNLDIAAGAGRLAYESGWSSLTWPQAPKTFCLEDISRFDLSTAGDVHRWSLPGEPLVEGTPRVQPCVDLPVMPADRGFRFQGVWPGIRLVGSSGAGFEIRTMNGRIQRADLTGGRLRSLEIDSNLSGIQTLDGAGDLRIDAHAAISDAASRVSSSLSGAGRPPLADLTLDAETGRVIVTAAQRAPTEDIVAAIASFLSASGVTLDGITPKGRIGRLTGELRFRGSAVTGASARLDVPAGPLASIELPATQPLRALDLAIAESNGPSGAVFEVNVDRVPDSGRASVMFSTDVSRLSLRAVDAHGADIQARLDLHADAHGALHDEVQPPHRIGTMLSSTTGDLARHVNSAVQVLGSPRPSAPATVDLGWNLRVRNSTAGGPFLHVDPEEIGLDLAADPAMLTWRRPDEPEGSTLTASGELGAVLTAHDDQLVLDAAIPVRLEASLGAQPRRRIAGDLDLLVAFGDALRPAPATSSGLWDADYYSRFWKSYPATRAGRSGAPLVDSPRLVAGPLSVRQVAGPLRPLRIAVGHGDRLELHAPFSGRALFGTANGLLETAIQWRGNQASLNSRFNLQLGKVQASAVGLDVQNAHVPLVEDELDADIRVRSDDLPLTRDTIDRLSALEPPDGLDRISLALGVHKSARSQSVPGVLQLSSGMQVNTFNRVLNAVVHDLQMAVPPQVMLYRNIDVNVSVDRGKVATGLPWVTLEGLRILSTPNLALEGTVRIHGGRNGDTLTLGDVLALFIRD
jgi:hypothetical protein